MSARLLAHERSRQPYSPQAKGRTSHMSATQKTPTQWGAQARSHTVSIPPPQAARLQPKWDRTTHRAACRRAAAQG